jgi:hypothetical protein
MNRKKLGRLRRELAKLREGAGGIGQRELERFAAKLGRRRRASGGEPQWMSDEPGVRPISIPGHKTINRFTAGSILDAFEADLDRLEEQIDEDSD